jgi:hypothetical protein
MTIGKATAVSSAVLAAFALGIWVGPYVTGASRADTAAMTPSAAAVPAPDVTAPAPAARRAANPSVALPAVPASSAELHQRLKPVLNQGMNLTIAAKGFHSGEQFAAVAHASRNLGVPFMVLKQRVLEEHRSLAAAIRELKPGVNAAMEANRAQLMARADIAAISV